METCEPGERRCLTRRRFLALALGSAGIGALAACSPSSPEPQKAAEAAKPAAAQPAPQPTAGQPAPQPAAAQPTPKPSAPKVLTIAQGSEIINLDPHNDPSEHARTLMSNMFDPLVERDDSMKLSPGLATSWRVVDDSTWEFQLRKGVKFHNGQEFTAEDVKFTVARVMDKANNLAMLTQVGPLIRAEVVDPYTVRVVTEPRYPLTPASISRLFIMPGKTFQEMGKDAFLKKPVGTGAFKLVEWVKDDHLTMDKSTESWRGSINADRIIWKPIPEPATRLASLVSGAAHLINPLDPENVGVVERNADLSVAAARGMRHMWIGMNCFEKPLDDIRVRKAIVLAIDVDGLIKTLMENRVYRIPGVLGGPEIFGYDSALKPYPYDPETSKKLLAEAGYANGIELEFITPNGRVPKDAESAQAVAGQLEKVGIRTKLQSLEWGAYRGLFEGKKAKGLHIWTSGTATLDADGVVYLNWHSQGRGIYYNSKRTDDLISQGRSIMNDAERLKIYSELQRAIAEDYAVVPMWQFQNTYGISKKLAGFVARTDERIYGHRLDLK